MVNTQRELPSIRGELRYRSGSRAGIATPRPNNRDQRSTSTNQLPLKPRKRQMRTIQRDSVAPDLTSTPEQPTNVRFAQAPSSVSLSSSALPM